MDPAVREAVRHRAEGRCKYCHLCQAQAPLPLFHIEHIRPKKHNGTDDVNNLCLACNYCNLHKSCYLTGIDPLTNLITRLFYPRTDKWEEHFQMNGALIVGRTAIGRVTVLVLNVNDQERLDLRLELLDAGSA